MIEPPAAGCFGGMPLKALYLMSRHKNQNQRQRSNENTTQQRQWRTPVIQQLGEQPGKGARGQDGGKGGRGRPPPQVRRPRQRRIPGEAALAEIRTMQKSTELIISKAAIMRVIREICQTSLGRKPGEDLRWTSPAE
eukprot:scaffold104588_cov63-Attheya_sp.AAC.1